MFGKRTPVRSERTISRTVAATQCTPVSIESVLESKQLKFSRSLGGPPAYISCDIDSTVSQNADKLFGLFSSNRGMYNALRSVCTGSYPCVREVDYMEHDMDESDINDWATVLEWVGGLHIYDSNMFYNGMINLSIDSEYAANMLNKAFAVIHAANELVRSGAYDVRYCCMLRDKQNNSRLPVDIIYQRKRGGRVEFVNVDIDVNLLNSWDMKKEQVKYKQRLGAYSLLVSSSRDDNSFTKEYLDAYLNVQANSKIIVAALEDMSELR